VKDRLLLLTTNTYEGACRTNIYVMRLFFALMFIFLATDLRTVLFFYTSRPTRSHKCCGLMLLSCLFNTCPFGCIQYASNATHYAFYDFSQRTLAYCCSLSFMVSRHTERFTCRRIGLYALGYYHTDNLYALEICINRDEKEMIYIES
jgi:hypothetical protein